MRPTVHASALAAERAASESHHASAAAREAGETGAEQLPLEAGEGVAAGARAYSGLSP